MSGNVVRILWFLLGITLSFVLPFPVLWTLVKAFGGSTGVLWLWIVSGLVMFGGLLLTIKVMFQIRYGDE